MKLQNIIIAASFVLLGTSAFTFKASTDFKIDEKYSIKFSATEAEGIIKGLKGTVKFNEANLQESSFNVNADVNTINTGNGMKNKHAKGDNWLDAEKYPTIKFVSTSIEKAGTTYKTEGKLTLKGVTKNITIPFSFSKTKTGGTFKGSFSIKRQDYNITEDGVGDNIKIELNIPVKK